MTDPFTPAVVRVQQAASDRDDKLALAVLELWDLIALALDLSDGEGVKDPETIAALRAQLAATSRRDWAERKRAEIDAAHAAARRQSVTPTIERRYDGSRAPDLLDQTDLVMERQRVLGRESQVARHLAMGLNPAGDGTDAHATTRKIRESMYARLGRAEQ
jgi:hypothetical protein